MFLIKIFIQIVFIFIFFILVHDGYKIYKYAKQSSVLIKNSKVFEKIHGTASSTILILGDSTAVGTGSKNAYDSIAGQFSARYPNANIINKGIIGERIHDVEQNINTQIADFTQSGNRADLVIIQIGANDVTHFTSAYSIKKDLTSIVSKVKVISNKIVLLHGGDVGVAPIIPWYLKDIFRKKTLQLRDIFLAVSSINKVTYIDIMFDGADDLFKNDTLKYFASDGFHPSSEGYKIWFEKITEVISI